MNSDGGDRRPGRRTGTRALLASLAAAVALAGTAWANSVASVVVGRDGRVFFSDYRSNRIWEVAPGGELRVRIRGKHTHHLALDDNGMLYGEHVPPDRRFPVLWRMAADGAVSDVPHASAADRGAFYEGTVFMTDHDGSLDYLKNCQIVRLSSDGRETALAGRSCAGQVWRSDALRYGHLHGSLVRAADGTIYFSDARTVRRVASDGSVSTLAGEPVELFAAPRPGEERFDRVMGLAVDPRGNLLVADRKSRSVIRIAAGGERTTLAKLGILASPIGLGISGEDILVVTEPRLPAPSFLAGLFGGLRVVRISPGREIRPVASVR